LADHFGTAQQLSIIDCRQNAANMILLYDLLFDTTVSKIQHK